MITVIAKAVLKEGTKEQFKEVTRNLVDGSRKETGNISYDLYEDMDDSSVMCFIEVWRDEAAIEAHNASGHFRDGIAAIKPLTTNLTVSRFGKVY
ncbi:MAG: antibiotic biosynthesis monooxygenase [Rikenellaceae bacterium]|nr:antibiotic biosynthesis monooxygenase [Rikenellaceae bacterium]